MIRETPTLAGTAAVAVPASVSASCDVHGVADRDQQVVVYTMIPVNF